jgi:predicted transcriptional regulator
MSLPLRKRLSVFVELEHDRRLTKLATMKGVSKSGLVAAALASFLSPEGLDRREAATAKRLDRLAQQFERLERDQTILLETLALFIRYELSISSGIPEAHQDAARAQGKARFGKFIEQLARHVQRGGSLVRDLHQEIYPNESQFVRSDDSGARDTEVHS